MKNGNIFFEDNKCKIGQHILKSRNISFFWKDTEQRFIGVNRCFLDTFGLKSNDEIIGKTIEDMHLHFNNDTLLIDENEVLTKGIPSINKVAKCIIQGNITTLLLTEEPIFREGKIVGIFGYFIQIDDIRTVLADAKRISVKDSITGLMSARSFLSNIPDFFRSMNEKGESFAILQLSLSQYDKIYKDCGTENACGLLCRIADILTEKAGNSASVARMYADSFIIYIGYREREQIERFSAEISRLISEIKLVGGEEDFDLTPEIKISYADNDENMKLLLSLDAEIDPVTGLYTHRAFYEKAERLMRLKENEPLLLVRFSIDDISLFENNFGLTKTEELLSLIAEQFHMRNSMEAVWGIYDNHQFIYCCTESYFNLQKAKKYEKLVQERLNVPFRLSLKHGIYRVADHTLPVETMCNRALLALNSVKDNYKEGYAFFTDQLLQESVLEQEIINDMVTALEEEQFSIWIQPQFNQWNSTLYGGEALARWHHPTKGMIPPSLFIPVFEKTGFISRLDEYVLKQVCRLQRRLLDSGYNVVPISVNLSPIDLLVDNICDRISAIVSHYHLSPDYINLEVTETAFVREEEKVIAVIEDFRRRGFKVEMDDFGSGYSSLNTLKNIPVDILKLDLKFLIGNNEKNGKILSAVVRMAHSLGLLVIAEGIENQEQADFLRSIGCFYAQGYFFARPMPEAEYEKVLESSRNDFAQHIRFTQRTQRATFLFSDTDAAKILLDNATGAAGVISYDGKDAFMIRMNDEFNNLIRPNIRPGGSFEHDFRRHFYEKDWKVFAETIERVIESEGTGYCDTALASWEFDGKIVKWLRTKFRYLQTNDGISTIYIMVENITHMKSTEEKLRLALSEYDILLSSALSRTINVEYYDYAFHISYINENAAMVFGFTQSEYLERLKDDIFSLIAPDEREFFVSQVEEAIRSGRNSADFYCHHLCRDGSLKLVRFVGKVDAGESGKLAGSILLLTESSDSLHDTVPKKNEFVTEEREVIDAFNFTNSELKQILAKKGTAYFRYSPVSDNILTANDEFYRILGFTKEEFSERYHDHFREMVYEDDLDEVTEHIENAKKKDIDHIECEYRIMTKSGKLKFVKTSSMLITGTNKKQWYFVIVKDIDKVKEREKEIERLRLYEKAMDKSYNNKILRYIVNGKRWSVDYISSSYLNMLGYTREEMLEYSRNDPLALIHPDDRERVRQNAINNVRNPKQHHIQYRIIAADGEYKWLDADINYIGTPGSGIQYMTHVDITSQKQLEEKLTEDNRQMQAILDAMSGCVILHEVCVDGVYTRFVSNGIRELSGHESEEYIGKTIDEQESGVSEQDNALVKEMISLAAEEGETPEFSIRCFNKNGEIVWLKIRGKSIGSKNGNPLILVVCHRISESDEQYEYVLDDVAVGIIIMERSTFEIFYINRIAADMCRRYFRTEPEAVMPIIKMEHKASGKSDIETLEMNNSWRWKYTYLDTVFNIRTTRQIWNGRDCIVLTAQIEENGKSE